MEKTELELPVCPDSKEERAFAKSTEKLNAVLNLAHLSYSCCLRFKRRFTVRRNTPVKVAPWLVRFG